MFKELLSKRWLRDPDGARKYPEHQGVQMSGAYALGMVAGSDDAKSAVINAKGIEAWGQSHWKRLSWLIDEPGADTQLIISFR